MHTAVADKARDVMTCECTAPRTGAALSGHEISGVRVGWPGMCANLVTRYSAEGESLMKPLLRRVYDKGLRMTYHPMLCALLVVGGLVVTGVTQSDAAESPEQPGAVCEITGSSIDTHFHVSATPSPILAPHCYAALLHLGLTQKSLYV